VEKERNKGEEISLCIAFSFLNRTVLYCFTDEYVDDNLRVGNEDSNEAEDGDYYDNADDENLSNSNSHSKVRYIYQLIEDT